MGRELKRKEAKKNKNVVQNKDFGEYHIQFSTILKVVGVVLLILLVLYYILAVFVTKEIDVSGSDETNSSENSDTASSVSNKILASNIFNQKEEVYYVYFYDFTDEDDAISSAISNQSDLKIYRVDTSSSLNSKYVTEDAGNINVQGIDDLKVKNPTFIEITNDTVTKYYEGKKNILEFLGE